MFEVTAENVADAVHVGPACEPKNALSIAASTDGGGLSDHVFAIMYLLGIRFQPRMSSPNDRRLYAFEAKGRYGVLAPFMGEPLDRKLIEANWGTCNASSRHSAIAWSPRR